MQRSTPSLFRLRTGVRIPPPPTFAPVESEGWLRLAGQTSRAFGELRLGEPADRRVIAAKAVAPKGEGGPTWLPIAKVPEF
jgi:hypothetical protein